MRRYCSGLTLRSFFTYSLSKKTSLQRQPYPPEITSALNAPETTLAVLGEGRLQEELRHDSVQVVHLRAHHAERHWKEGGKRGCSRAGIRG